MKTGNLDSECRIRIPCLMVIMMLIEDMQIALYRYATEFVFIVLVDVNKCAYIVHGAACADLQFYTVKQMAYYYGREYIACARYAYWYLVECKHEMLLAGWYAEAFDVSVVAYH